MFGLAILFSLVVVIPILLIVEWDYKRRYKAYYGHTPLPAVYTSDAMPPSTGVLALDSAMEDFYADPNGDTAVEVQYQVESAQELIAELYLF